MRSPRFIALIPLVLAMLSMIGPFSIDTPFPAFAEMGEALEVSSGELQLVVTAYMLAFASMSLFHGPLSDAIGRRPVIMGSLVAYAATTVSGSKSAASSASPRRRGPTRGSAPK